MLKARLREAPTHAFVVLSFLAVALAASSRFADQFTSVKWRALEALGLLWFLAEWLRGPEWPPLSRRGGVALAGFVVLVVAGSLRQGPAWATEPLLARAGFCFVALASYAYFRRTDRALGPLRAAMAAACAVVVGLGFLQLAGRRPLFWLTAGDQVSATFGNVNMAAQFVALALVVLASGNGGGAEAGRSRAETMALAGVAAAGLAYLYVLGSRSAPLALSAALFFLLLVDRKRKVVGVAAMAALVVAVLQFLPGASGPRQSGGTAAHKRESARVRLAVWSDAWDLVRDRPLGVGAGNFEQAFIPYALGGRTRPDESLVFRSPHNEYLRLLAEEGMVASSLLVALLIGLGRALHRSPTVASWRSPPGRLIGSVAVFLAVEAFFQFPFEMAFPALTASVVLGLAGACLGPAAARPRASLLVALLAMVGVAWGLVRVVRAELLWVGARSDVRAQEEACRLDPRRLEACTEEAWLRIRSDDHEAGRRALAGVLERAPHYFPAIKLLGEDSMARGDREGGCFYLGLYDALFDGRSTLHAPLLQECSPAALDAGRRQVSIPHYRAFPFLAGDR